MAVVVVAAALVVALVVLAMLLLVVGIVVVVVGCCWLSGVVVRCCCCWWPLAAAAAAAACWPPLTGIRRRWPEAATAALIGKAGENELGCCCCCRGDELVAAPVKPVKKLALVLSGGRGGDPLAVVGRRVSVCSAASVVGVAAVVVVVGVAGGCARSGKEPSAKTAPESGGATMDRPALAVWMALEASRITSVAACGCLLPAAGWLGSAAAAPARGSWGRWLGRLAGGRRRSGCGCGGSAGITGGLAGGAATGWLAAGAERTRCGCAREFVGSKNTWLPGAPCCG